MCQKLAIRYVSNKNRLRIYITMHIKSLQDVNYPLIIDGMSFLFLLIYFWRDFECQYFCSRKTIHCSDRQYKMDKPHSMSRIRKWLVIRNSIIHAISHVRIHKILSCLFVCNSILVLLEKPQPIVFNQCSSRATRRHYWGDYFYISLTLTCFRYI